MNGFQQNMSVIYDWALFRRDVRRDVRNCVLFLLLFFIVSLIVSFTVEVVSLSAIIGIAAGSCVFWIWRKKRFFGDIILPAAERMTPKIFFVLVVLTQGFQCVYAFIMIVVDALLPGGLSLRENYTDTIEELYTPVGFLYIVLIGPIFEELIFRGAVLGALRRFGDNFAILFSSLLFGLYHMILLQIPFAFVLGLLLGYAAARWSLRTSIVLHIIVNGLSSLMTVIGDNYNAAAIYGFSLFTCAILTLIFAVIWRRQFWARVRWSAAYYPHTYANGFLSIAFWIFAALSVGIGILSMTL